MKKKTVNWKEGIILAIVLSLWLKLLLTITGYNLASYFKEVPLTTRQMDLSELIPKDRESPWYNIAQPFHRFDALWYEGVAKTSYKGLPLSTPFFPLYPVLINTFSILFQVPFYISAYFLNFFLTVFFLFLFYLLVFQESRDKNLARKTVILFAVFPTSFFLLAPYADPLLLSLFFLSIILAKRKKFFLSGVSGFLAAMAKPYGFLIFIPIAVLAIQGKSLTEKIKQTIWILLIPLGTVAILVFQNLMIGQDKLEISKGISGWNMALVNPIIRIWDSLFLFLRNPVDLPNVLNLLTIGIVIVYLIYYRPKKKEDIKKDIFFNWIYVLVFFLVFALYQPKGVPLKSFARYYLTFFPIFIVMARWKTGTLINTIYIGSSLSLMVIFFIYYVFGFFTF